MTDEEKEVRDAKRADAARQRFYETEIKFAEDFRKVRKLIPFGPRNMIANMTGRIFCGIYEGDELNTVDFVRSNRAAAFAPYKKYLKEQPDEL